MAIANRGRRSTSCAIEIHRASGIHCDGLRREGLGRAPSCGASGVSPTGQQYCRLQPRASADKAAPAIPAERWFNERR
jgi:hypothetical protein